MATVFFQISLNIAEERHVTQGGDNENQEGSEENKDREKDGNQEELGNERLTVPIPLDGVDIALIHQPEGVECHGVDSLPRTIRK